MLMHQGIGLDRFNALPTGRATHALYECCCSVVWADRVASGRPYGSHDALLTSADSELFELSTADVDTALHSHRGIAHRVRSHASALEQCAVWTPDEATMRAIVEACDRYEQQFGYPYLWCAGGRDATDLLRDLADRMGHSPDIERKTMLGELAKVNRTRIQRMLGPEGGFDYYA